MQTSKPLTILRCRDHSNNIYNVVFTSTTPHFPLNSIIYPQSYPPKKSPQKNPPKKIPPKYPQKNPQKNPPKNPPKKSPKSPLNFHFSQKQTAKKSQSSQKDSSKIYMFLTPNNQNFDLVIFFANTLNRKNHSHKKTQSQRFSNKKKIIISKTNKHNSPNHHPSS